MKQRLCTMSLFDEPLPLVYVIKKAHTGMHKDFSLGYLPSDDLLLKFFKERGAVMLTQAKCLFCGQEIDLLGRPSFRQNICSRCWVQSARQHHKELLFGLGSPAGTLKLNLKDFQMTVRNEKYNCSACGGQFVFVPEKENLQSIQGFQASVQCPACRALLRQKRGSGRDTGQSHIQYGICIKCSSETEYFPLPNKQHTLYCSECAKAYASLPH